MAYLIPAAEQRRPEFGDYALPNTMLSLFGVNHNAKYRALAALQQVGLIEVEGQPDRNPLVALLDAENLK